MAIQLSNMQETDSEHEKRYTEEDRKGDTLLLIAILILLAGVGAYLYFNPDESTLRKGTAIKEAITNPVPKIPVTLAPVIAEPVKPEPVMLETSTPEPVTPEPVTPEPVTPEPVTPEPVTPEPVTPKPVTPKPAALEPTAPAGSHSVSTQSNQNSFAWAVNLASVTTQSSADKIIEQLKAEGIEAEKVPVNVKERTYYRIRIGNLTSRQEANAAKASFKDKPAYKDAWINRYPK